jgi:transposase
MENTIVLTMKEERRVEVIQRVFRAEMTMVEAALVLRVTERQSYRIKAKIREEGVRGVIHGDRGRRCAWKLSEKAERKIVEAARGKYRGFNDHHLTEKLAQEEGIKLSREKVRRVLRAQGISSPRKRRAPKHRSRRERREAEGMIVQIDGSPHDWHPGQAFVLTYWEACRNSRSSTCRSRLSASLAYKRLTIDGSR